jgi:predicted nucleic acid-binding protein
MPCVVADTSPLFYLAQLDLLRVLSGLYGKVHVPPVVWAETLAGGRAVPSLMPRFCAAEAEGWIVVSPPVEAVEIAELDDLDAGEREAIILARNIEADLLMVDERLGRIAARRLGLKIIGTLGVLAEAKRAGLISALKPLFALLRRETNFRCSDALEREVLESAGEAP